jgi:hypothetical protein
MPRKTYLNILKEQVTCMSREELLERIAETDVRLKTTEDMIRELEEDLRGKVKGALISKYVNCGKCRYDCRHGPYFYLEVRSEGKVKWKYLGRKVPDNIISGTAYRGILKQINSLTEKRRMLEDEMRVYTETLNNFNEARRDESG